MPAAIVILQWYGTKPVRLGIIYETGGVWHEKSSRKSGLSYFDDCFFLTAILLVMTACIDKTIKDGTKSEIVETEAGINDDTCFNIEDFSCIVVGQSTFQDVYEITSCGGLVSSACGAAAEYPTENGYVRIEFSGSDLVVVRLEEKTGTSRVWEHIKKID